MNFSINQLRLAPVAGFSLVEAVVSMGIIAFAGSVLLLAVESTMSSVTSRQEALIADGMARQMLDEIQGQSWVDPLYQSDPNPINLGPSSAESAGPGRSLFDDNDDYHQWIASPPVRTGGETLASADRLGTTLPSAFRVRDDYFDTWRRVVTISYVDETNPSSELPNSSPTNMRTATCEIYRQNRDGTWRLILERKRVFTYVPS